MTLVLDGTRLTPEQVARLARGTQSVELSAAGRARNEATYRAALALAASDRPVYGLSTGVGALKTTAVADGSDFQKRLLRSHCAGAGEQVLPEVGRATLVVRANQLAAGGAGVHPELLEALVHALNLGAAPRFRALGSVGTGDLCALAEIGLSLVGERPLPGMPPLPPAPLGPRDGLMLMSSNAYSVAQAALACADARVLAEAAEVVAALSFAGAGASVRPLDARVHAARPHPGQVAAAARLRAVLPGEDPPSARLQDSFGFRCAPQLLGALRDALGYLETVLGVELNAAAENALLLPSGEALPNGNFHGAPLALALDLLRNALAQAAQLSLSRLSDLLSSKVTGLADFLAREPGPDSGLMVLEYTAADAAAELRALAAPVGQPAALSHGVESHASFANLGARHTTRALERYAVVVACELLASVRALRQRRGLGAPVRELLERLRGLPAEQADRPLVDDLERAVALLPALVEPARAGANP